MSVAINIEKVTKRFGKDTIIDGLSLEIKPGEFFTLLGPSGCGKTTLLRMIIGFNTIEGGEIKIDGKVINHIPTNCRNMGMVFQNYAVFPHMSVRDNVAFGLKNRKLSKGEMTERVDEILKTVKIDHLQKRMPEKLSGGQQQRVALARAIVIRPEVLLMDEPLSNLDAKLRVEMRNAIKQIQQETGITTVYVTHDQEEALAVSDRIAIMNAGVIQQIDTPKNIYQRPANLFVSTFIGLSNILEGKVAENRGNMGIQIGEYFFSIEEVLENLEDENHTVEERFCPGQSVKVSVRPEEFEIDTTGTEGIPVTVKRSIFLGESTHYFVETSEGTEMEVIQSSDLQDIIPEGTKISLKVQPHRVNLFNPEGTENLLMGGGCCL